MRILTLLLLLFTLLQLKEQINALPSLKRFLSPPKPRWGPNRHLLQQQNSNLFDIVLRLICFRFKGLLELITGIAFDYWTDDHEEHLWEHSGLMEGDIMVHHKTLRNGLLNENSLWPKAVVPFYIEPEHFSKYFHFVILIN